MLPFLYLMPFTDEDETSIFTKYEQPHTHDAVPAPRETRHQERAMAKVTILYWQEIPSLVEARDRSGRHKIELSQRFQELIDLVAMKKKMAGTDEYLIQWNKGQPKEHEGDPETTAKAVAGEIEARYETIRAEELAKCKA